MPVLDYLQHAAPAWVVFLFLHSDAVSGLGHGMKQSFPRADRSQIPSPGQCGSPRTGCRLFASVLAARLAQSHESAQLPSSGRWSTTLTRKPEIRLRSSMISRLRWAGTQVESALSTRVGAVPSDHAGSLSKKDAASLAGSTLPWMLPCSLLIRAFCQAVTSSMSSHLTRPGMGQKR